jgi:uncharacterized membrane protein
MTEETFDLRGGIGRKAPISQKNVVPQKIYDDIALMSAKTGGIKYTPFTRDDCFTLGDGNERTPYFRRQDHNKSAVKWGQLKLLTTEIQFLTLFWDPRETPNPICVYVGAALGTHIATLCLLFPSFEFHLYDNRNFDPILKKHNNVFLHEHYFTPEDAAKWEEVNDRVFFISDIRASTYVRVENESLEYEQKQNETLVWNDMQLQQSWVEKIKPHRAHLKFRLPYAYKFILEENKSREYLDGFVFIQPWAGQSSSECRLVPYPDFRKRDWDLKTYEDMIFHHNAVVRESRRYINPLTGRGEPIAAQLGLNDDYDSTCFTQIIFEYLSKFKINITPEKVIAVITSVIRGANNGRTDLLGLRSGIKTASMMDDD